MKIKSVRKLLVCLSILFLSVIITACVTNQNSSSKQVEITFWHGMTGERKTALDDIIKDYNHSQSKYKVVGVSQGNIGNVQKKITAAAKSDTLPTISQTVYTNIPNYVQGGFVVPFDKYISKSDLSDIYPSFLTANKYHGKYYSMPFSKSVQVMYFNQDLIKEKGITVPTTWSAIQSLGAQYKSEGIAAVGFDQSFLTTLNTLATQAGTPLISKSLKVNINASSTIKAAHVIWDMLQTGEAKTAGDDLYGNSALFKGQTLFYIGSSAGLSTVESSAPKGFNLATAPLPSYNGQKATSLAGNDITMFKSASTAQRKGASEFIKYLMSEKQSIKWAEATGYVPLTKSAATNKAYQAYLNKHPNQKAAANSVSFGFSDPVFLNYEQYFTDSNDAVSEMTTNNVTPETALNKLQKQTEKIIK